MAFEDALVSRVGSSLAPGTSVLGGEGRSVLVDGAGPSSKGSSIRDTASGSTPVFGCVSVRVGRTPLRSLRVWGVVGAVKIAAHQSSRDEGNVSGIAVISGVGHRSCDRDVRQLDDCGGTVSRSLCSLASRLARYLPWQSNVLADLLSRRDQAIGTEWSLHP